MLRPHDRRVLMEALRPPQGYTVDRALATTYSLDLVALLIAPLSFSMFDRAAQREGSVADEADPVGATALLQAVRKHANNLSVFCQVGHIAHPGQYRQLLAHLEGSVVEVRPRSDQGVFHPKVWVQRFTKPEAATLYRVVVNSRNLTFDRSWDTMLVLEGELAVRSNGFTRNRPLSDFIAALPGLAVRAVPGQVAKDTAELADELRRVEFEIPDEFDELTFWPIGHDGKGRWPFTGKIDRMLVVSPFIAADTLARLTENGDSHVLVSRPEELAQLSAKALVGFDEIHVLNEGAEVETEDAAVDAPRAEEAARGLHAKLYVADSGARGRLWTGSANASVAAFQHNVEFLVELAGKKSNVGVDAMLGKEGGEMSLRTLLVEYTPAEDALLEDAAEKALEQRIRVLRALVANAPWKARVEREPEPDDDKERYRLHLHAEGAKLDLGPGAEVRCWPIAVTAEQSAGMTIGLEGTSAVFPRLSFQALTSFFAFNLRVQEGPHNAEAVFVVNAPLSGAPEHRHARILLAMLDDPAKVMRFLRMLLALDPAEGIEELLGGEGEWDAAAGGWSGGGSGTPILEALLCALDRDPARLSEFDRTVRELRTSAEGAALLPADLDQIWEPIRAAWVTRGGGDGR